MRSSPWAHAACFVIAIGVGCAGTQTAPATSPDVSAQPQGSGATAAVAESEARAIAEQHAKDAGYDVNTFPVVSVRRATNSSEDTWIVFFEHVPPTPPGGHFHVYVDAVTKAAKLIPGR